MTKPKPRVPDVVPTLADGEAATLAQCNAMFLRQHNPLVFGDEHEREEAKHSEGRAAMEKAEREFLDAQAVQTAINGMHTRELERIRREQGIEAPAVPEMSAEEQAALAALAVTLNA